MYYFNQLAKNPLFTLLLFAPLFMGGCGVFEEQPPAARKPMHVQAKPHYQISEFVEHVSLAEMLLENNVTDNTTLSPHFTVIEGYTARPQKNTISQPVVVLSYSEKDAKTIHRMIVPFSVSDSSVNVALVESMNLLGSLQFTIHDVRTAMLPLAHMNPVKFQDDSMEKVKVILEYRVEAWLKTLQYLRPLTDAETQVQLLRFFMDHHIKDAAYLSADNAKQSLATCAEHGVDPQAVKYISQQLAGLESRLRKEMPYTFNGL